MSLTLPFTFRYLSEQRTFFVCFFHFLRSPQFTIFHFATKWKRCVYCFNAFTKQTAFVVFLSLFFSYSNLSISSWSWCQCTLSPIESLQKLSDKIMKSPHRIMIKTVDNVYEPTRKWRWRINKKEPHTHSRETNAREKYRQSNIVQQIIRFRLMSQEMSEDEKQTKNYNSSSINAIILRLLFSLSRHYLIIFPVSNPRIVGDRNKFHILIFFKVNNNQNMHKTRNQNEWRNISPAFDWNVYNWIHCTVEPIARFVFRPFRNGFELRFRI